MLGKNIVLTNGGTLHNSSIQWKAPPPTPLYTHPFVYVIGLYSRHGMFYPPYNYIPDINYLEFFQNIEQF